MPRIRFEDLLPVYRSTRFGEGGADDESRLSVASQSIKDLLTRLESNDDEAHETGIFLRDDLSEVALGAEVRLRVDTPRVGLGVLARNVDQLLASPNARIKEPKRYFLVDPPFTPGDTPEPEVIARYKKVLAIVDLLADVSSFLDETQAELVLVQEGKVVIPIRFKAADLPALNTGDADRLLGQFADELHRDQKQEILFRAILELCRAHAIDTRFARVLRNLGHLADAVSQGYRMFASSFSYAKIRGELDDARIEYTGKIHKTVFDIQNQLLGIPLATVVVASQMKVPTSCGIES